MLPLGVDESTAAAIVLLFRGVTYWLPTIPGYLAMRHVERVGLG